MDPVDLQHAAFGLERPWHQGFDPEAFLVRGQLYKFLQAVGLARVTEFAAELVDLENGNCDGTC